MLNENAKDKEHYKKANRTVKERNKERKNKTWEVKYRKVDNMVGGS